MAAYFTLTLDTTAPSGGSISVISLTNVKTITATLTATDATQMFLSGDIEGGGTWETFATSKSIVLSGSDGTKTIKVKFRDAVGNETAEYTATTVLDTTGAVVTVSGVDKNVISKVDGYNVASFSFSADTEITAWEVRVVPATGSVHTAGTVIGTTNGSENTSGNTTKAANTAVTVSINGADLEAASAGDGAKIIKVFVQDAAGNWSA